MWKIDTFVLKKKRRLNIHICIRNIIHLTSETLKKRDINGPKNICMGCQEKRNLLEEKVGKGGEIDAGIYSTT